MSDLPIWNIHTNNIKSISNKNRINKTFFKKTFFRKIDYTKNNTHHKLERIYLPHQHLPVFHL